MRRRRDRFDVSKVEKPGIAALTGDAAQPSTSHGGGVRLDQSVGKQQSHTGPAGAASGAMPIAPTRVAPPAGERLLAWLGQTRAPEPEAGRSERWVSVQGRW